MPRKVNILLLSLDLLTFLRFFWDIPFYFQSSISNELGSLHFLAPLLIFSKLVLLLSLLLSAFFYWKKPVVAYLMYYPQFFLKLLHLILSFGFITHLNYFFGSSIFYQILIYLAIALEIGRLVVTIYLHRNSKKYKGEKRCQKMLRSVLIRQ